MGLGPGPGGGGHPVPPVLPRPSEVLARTVRGSHELRRVARPAWLLVRGYLLARDAPHGVHDLLDRVPRPAAEVVDAVLTRPDGVERQQVRLPEILDVDVVAHGRPVARRVVRAEH